MLHCAEIICINSFMMFLLHRHPACSANPFPLGDGRLLSLPNQYWISQKIGWEDGRRQEKALALRTQGPTIQAANNSLRALAAEWLFLCYCYWNDLKENEWEFWKPEGSDHALLKLVEVLLLNLNENKTWILCRLKGAGKQRPYPCVTEGVQLLGCCWMFPCPSVSISQSSS